MHFTADLRAMLDQPTDPAVHTAEEIRQVARGLSMVVAPEVAATQLRRIYGEDRAAQVLLPLAPRPTGRIRSVSCTTQPTRNTARAPRPALAATAAPAGRRGRRPSDWL